MSSLATALGLTFAAASGLSHTHTNAPSTGPILSWPAEMLPMMPVEPVREHADDDYELQMKDIGDQIYRFRGEKRGRCYASCGLNDILTDVWRKVFDSYPANVQNGDVPPADDHHSGVFWRDIKAAREMIELIENIPRSLPRANAESGTN